MHIDKGLRLVFNVLMARKKRTFLAMLGIAIGVAAVVAIISLGEGNRKEIAKQVENMGTNLLIISAGKDNKNLPGKSKQVSNVMTLSIKDADYIKKEIPDVVLAVPAQVKKMQVKYEDKVITTFLTGTLPDFQEIRNFWPDEGEFFTDEDVLASKRVAVIGKTVAENLFSKTDPIGEAVKINNVRFTVVGVLKEKGVDINGQDQDDQILIPLTTALRKVFNITYLSNIFVQVQDLSGMKETEKSISELLLERHKIKNNLAPDFTIMNQVDLLAAQDEIQKTYTTLLVSIAGVSLFIGGIGILAVMLISIRERTWEIGLLRAIGARRKDIMLQFLLEALALSVGGGLLGIVFALSAVYLLTEFFQWTMVITWWTVVPAFIFSLVLGVIFGVYPAKKASELNPIDALKSR